MPTLMLMRKPTKENYNQQFLQALLEAAGGEVKFINGSDESQTHSDKWFRDLMVILPDRKLILLSGKAESGQQKTQHLICDEITSRDSTFQPFVTDAYFEGGNVFYIAEKKLLIHGNDAQGHYGDFSPSEQTQQMSRDLSSHEIEVLGINLSNEAKEARGSDSQFGFVHAYYFYHLDTFMQTMPDGRVLIMNAKILSPESLAALKSRLGDKLIDLAYDAYLTKPYILNFSTVPYRDSFRIVSDTLPDEISLQLVKLGYTVISPKTFLPVSPAFHEGLNETVMRNMRESGYQGPFSDTSLICHDEHLFVEIIKAMVGFAGDENPLNPGGNAGLHCLVLDIPGLGNVDETSICHHNLNDSKAEEKILSPQDWVDTINASELSRDQKLPLFNLLTQIYPERHNKVIFLHCIFNIMKDVNQFSSIYDYNALKKHNPDLTPEIGAYIEANLAIIFFNTHRPQFFMDDFKNLTLDMALPHATSSHSIVSILDFFCDAYYHGKDLKSKQAVVRQVGEYVLSNLGQVIHSEQDKSALCKKFPMHTTTIQDFEIQSHIFQVEDENESTFEEFRQSFQELIVDLKDASDKPYSIRHLPYAAQIPSAATLIKNHRLLNQNELKKGIQTLRDGTSEAPNPDTNPSVPRGKK